MTSSSGHKTLLYKTKLRLKISCLHGDFKVILTMSVQTLVQNENYTDVDILSIYDLISTRFKRQKESKLDPNCIFNFFFQR